MTLGANEVDCSIDAPSDNSQSGDLFLQALDDMQRANQRAIDVARDRLAIVNERYYGGADPKQSVVEVDACARVQTSMTSLGAIAGEPRKSARQNSMYRLPVEILCFVFRSLDMNALTACRDTCQLWQSVLASNAARQNIWKGTFAALHGTIGEIESMWTKARNTPIAPSKLSLKPKLSPMESYLRLYDIDSRINRQMRLVQELPTELLTEVEYEGNIRCQDAQFWRFVERCPYLKKLHWTTWETPNARTKEIHFCIHSYDEEELLRPSCRLEEFTFTSNTIFTFGDNLVTMLSQVKRLVVRGGLRVSLLERVFEAAKDYLEDIIVAKIDKFKHEGCGIEISSYISMRKLQRMILSDCVFCDECITFNISFSAPQMTHVRFDGQSKIDWTLLDSCRNRLKSLFIEVKKSDTRTRLAMVLSQMHQLEDLQLDYRRGEMSCDDMVRSLSKDHEHDSAKRCLDALISHDTLEIQALLPKLRSFAIHHDSTLSEEIMETGHFQDLATYQVAKVRLSSDTSGNSTPFVDLERACIGVSFQEFEDWRKIDPENWSLSIDLFYNRGVRWQSLDACWGFLNALTISVDLPDDRLKEELFDIPQLKDLTLDFGPSNSDGEDRSATALWTAITKGSTRRRDVKVQDILPSLEKLTVINDALVGEEVVIRLVDLRKSLGLSRLEKLSLRLAKTCSRDHARLDILKHTMPGFSYTVYDEEV